MDDLDILPPDEGVPDAGIVDDLKALANAAENTVAGRFGAIQMVGVSSTDIAAWGYDPVGFKLQIQFTNGRMYLYENISPIEFEQLTLAPSKGSAFWALVRRNPVNHPFTRLA